MASYRQVYLLFLIAFVGVTTASVSMYYHARGCTSLGPTISSSLFQKYWQGVAVVLFFSGFYVFLKDKEKLLSLSLGIMTIAFVVPGSADNGVHIIAVFAATALLWIAVVHKLWYYKPTADEKLCCFGPKTVHAISWVLWVVSVVSGGIFFVFVNFYWDDDVVEKRASITDGSYYSAPDTASLTTCVDSCRSNASNAYAFYDGLINACSCGAEAATISKYEDLRYFYVKIGNVCHWAGITEYVAFATLFLCTYVLIPNDTFDFFEDNDRQPRTIKNFEMLKEAVFAPVTKAEIHSKL